MSKRSEIRHRIQQFYHQLTAGCGKVDCHNENCASNTSFTPLLSNEAAAKAIQLFQNKGILCVTNDKIHKTNSGLNNGATQGGSDNQDTDFSHEDMDIEIINKPCSSHNDSSPSSAFTIKDGVRTASTNYDSDDMDIDHTCNNNDPVKDTEKLGKKVIKDATKESDNIGSGSNNVTVKDVSNVSKLKKIKVDETNQSNGPDSITSNSFGKIYLFCIFM